MDQVSGLGRALFAAVLLMVGGVLNIIYGIAAIGNSSFFVHNTKYVFASLKGWGWITLILGILELLASVSLFGGGATAGGSQSSLAPWPRSARCYRSRPIRFGRSRSSPSACGSSTDWSSTASPSPHRRPESRRAARQRRAPDHGRQRKRLNHCSSSTRAGSHTQ